MSIVKLIWYFCNFVIAKQDMKDLTKEDLSKIRNVIHLFLKLLWYGLNTFMLFIELVTITVY